MKRFLRVLILTGVMGIWAAMPVFAEDATFYMSDEGTSVLVQSKTSESKVYDNSARGVYFSEGALSISNIGEGKIGIYMDTLCHVPVDKITMGVFVDQLNDAGDDWVQMEYREFKFLASDTPGENLTSKSIAFEVTGYPVNRYYRLRGLHSVKVGSKSEAYASRTDGILISKEPYSLHD